MDVRVLPPPLITSSADSMVEARRWTTCRQPAEAATSLKVLQVFLDSNGPKTLVARKDLPYWPFPPTIRLLRSDLLLHHRSRLRRHQRSPCSVHPWLPQHGQWHQLHSVPERYRVGP